MTIQATLGCAATILAALGCAATIQAALGLLYFLSVNTLLILMLL